MPIEEQIRKICDIVDGDISAEVVSTDSKEMIDGGPQTGEDSQERSREMLPMIARRNQSCKSRLLGEKAFA